VKDQHNFQFCLNNVREVIYTSQAQVDDITSFKSVRG
jgi:hypothetical protein